MAERAPEIHELGVVARIYLRRAGGEPRAGERRKRLLSLLDREIVVFPSRRFGWRVHDSGRYVAGAGGWRPTAGMAIALARRLATEHVGSGEYLFGERRPPSPVQEARAS